MKEEEIIIKISKDGKVSMHIKGVKGKACVNITKDLEKELGAIDSRTYTSDYYDESNVAIAPTQIVKK